MSASLSSKCRTWYGRGAVATLPTYWTSFSAIGQSQFFCNASVLNNSAFANSDICNQVTQTLQNLLSVTASEVEWLHVTVWKFWSESPERGVLVWPFPELPSDFGARV